MCVFELRIVWRLSWWALAVKQIEIVIKALSIATPLNVVQHNFHENHKVYLAIFFESLTW